MINEWCIYLNDKFKNQYRGKETTAELLKIPIAKYCQDYLTAIIL